MENVPLIVLKKIFKYLPRRTVEDVVINVCQTWHTIGTILMSEEIFISDFCNLPPGYGDYIGMSYFFGILNKFCTIFFTKKFFFSDLNLTRRISISSGWTCKWWECEGLKRDYFENLLRQLSPNSLESIRCRNFPPTRQLLVY